MKTNINCQSLLSPEQVELLKDKGEEFLYAADSILIKEGQKKYDFIIILEGAIKIVEPYTKTIVVTHRESGFVGDSDILSDRAAIFRAVAATDVRVVRISQANLLTVLAENVCLNEVLITAFLLRREELAKQGRGGLILIGSKFSPQTFQLREFFTKNHLQHTFYTVEDSYLPREVITNFNISADDLPVVIDPDFTIRKKPTIDEIARLTGIQTNVENRIFDVMVVGAGPGGLAASVYGASEGLDTITIDRIGPGGQAGTTSKIENYLGFPTGISGSDLAHKAYIQAQKFGCTVSIPECAEKLEKEGHIFKLLLKNGETIRAKAVVAATGASYRDLPIENMQYYRGRGLYYSATAMEATICKNGSVAIVGGGNSAGQAAIYLSDYASEIYLIIRGDSLHKSMSSYLINRIHHNPKITLLADTEIKGLYGKECLEHIKIYDKTEDRETTLNIAYIFLFLGAVPATGWLLDTVCLDDKGFVITGNDLGENTLQKYNWALKRDPFPLETCIPGLFAVGDLRSGSTKRVAAAVGEGAMAISYVYRYLSSDVS